MNETLYIFSFKNCYKGKFNLNFSKDFKKMFKFLVDKSFNYFEINYLRRILSKLNKLFKF